MCIVVVLFIDIFSDNVYKRLALCMDEPGVVTAVFITV